MHGVFSYCKGKTIETSCLFLSFGTKFRLAVFAQIGSGHRKREAHNLWTLKSHLSCGQVKYVKSFAALAVQNVFAYALK